MVGWAPRKIVGPTISREVELATAPGNRPTHPTIPNQPVRIAANGNKSRRKKIFRNWMIFITPGRDPPMSEGWKRLNSICRCFEQKETCMKKTAIVVVCLVSGRRRPGKRRGRGPESRRRGLHSRRHIPDRRQHPRGRLRGERHGDTVWHRGAKAVDGGGMKMSPKTS